MLSIKQILNKKKKHKKRKSNVLSQLFCYCCVVIDYFSFVIGAMVVLAAFLILFWGEAPLSTKALEKLDKKKNVIKVN